jgi:hypothetical protein
VPIFINHKIPELIADRYQVIGSEDELKIPRFRDLNVFIGPNNSGKSILIRSLFAHRPSDSSATKIGVRKKSVIKKVYIPVLRGLRPLNLDPGSQQDLYKTRTMKDLFPGTETSFKNRSSFKTSKK